VPADELNPILFVHQAVLQRMARLPPRPFEVGGWLLGYWSEDETTVVVTHGTPPTLGTPFGVNISAKGHRRYFDEAWGVTDGAVTFLGDWHTHPGSPPRPSPRDKKALGQLASDAQFGTPRPLIAIVAVPPWPRSPYPRSVAFYTRADGVVTSLVPHVVDEVPEPACCVEQWRWPSVRPGELPTSPPQHDAGQTGA
jgi:integrative and conjugative element protein (TIGR02256 family)